MTDERLKVLEGEWERLFAEKNKLDVSRREQLKKTGTVKGQVEKRLRKISQAMALLQKEFETIPHPNNNQDFEDAFWSEEVNATDLLDDNALARLARDMPPEQRIEEHKRELDALAKSGKPVEIRDAERKRIVEKIQNARAEIMKKPAPGAVAHPEQRLDVIKIAVENKKDDVQREFTRTKPEQITLAKRLKREGKTKWQAAETLFPSQIKAYKRITSDDSVARDLRRKKRQAIEKRVQNLWN